MTKIVDVPPCRAYVCIAFLRLSIDGALRVDQLVFRLTPLYRYLQDSVQAFLVDRHLNSDVGQEVVDSLVWTGFPGRVVL